MVLAKWKQKRAQDIRNAIKYCDFANGHFLNPSGFDDPAECEALTVAQSTQNCADDSTYGRTAGFSVRCPISIADVCGSPVTAGRGSGRIGGVNMSEPEVTEATAVCARCGLPHVCYACGVVHDVEEDNPNCNPDPSGNVECDLRTIKEADTEDAEQVLAWLEAAIREVCDDDTENAINDAYRRL